MGAQCAGVQAQHARGDQAESALTAASAQITSQTTATNQQGQLAAAMASLTSTAAPVSTTLPTSVLSTGVTVIVAGQILPAFVEEAPQ